MCFPLFVILLLTMSHKWMEELSAPDHFANLTFSFFLLKIPTSNDAKVRVADAYQ